MLRGHNLLSCDYGEELTTRNKTGKEKRNFLSKYQMWNVWRGNIRSGLNREGFKPLTKLRSWFFPRGGAITPVAHFHAAINRNQARIGIEAQGKKETNKKHY